MLCWKLSGSSNQSLTKRRLPRISRPGIDTCRLGSKIGSLRIAQSLPWVQQTWHTSTCRLREQDRCLSGCETQSLWPLNKQQADLQSAIFMPASMPQSKCGVDLVPLQHRRAMALCNIQSQQRVCLDSNSAAETVTPPLLCYLHMILRCTGWSVRQKREVGMPSGSGHIGRLRTGSENAR